MAAAAAATSDNPPSNTVYVRNLEERVKIPTLTSSLREIFSEYGNIIDLVAKRNLRAKGQAFVVFDNAESAATAIDEIQGFELFDKPMILDFAKTRSDASVKLTGSEEEFEAHRRHRLAEKERRQAAEKQSEAQQAKLKRPAQVAGEGDVQQQARPAKTTKGAGLKSTSGAGAVVPDEYLPPNKILFVQNIPDDYDVEELTAVFTRFEGFREVRMVPGRKGLAFVEYEAESGAISAKESTGGTTLGGEGKPIKVTYQRQ